ncbi:MULTISPECIES: hypothetical protein [Halorussus]|uniref:hypothetical protein n=1 Tax=Halorussus TaxID=1070314 RepID=UPI00209EEECA|nr:hypothetical protein [Halorussus vallis]USZ78717.1 hypothetical protein NGM07_24715 [Halorussus vallis]
MTVTDRDLEEFYAERIEQYRDLNARDSTQDGYFIVDCPGECGRPMHLGRGWRGCSIPTCPSCNETADEWGDDPRISEERADELAAEETSVRELVVE